MKYFISFILGAVFAVMLCASQGLVTEVVVEKEVIKEVPVEVIVEKETSDTAEVKNIATGLGEISLIITRIDQIINPNKNIPIHF